MNYPALSDKKRLTITFAMEIPKYLTTDEVQHILASVSNKARDRLLISMLWQTGARVSENLKSEIKKYLKGHKHEYLFCKDDGRPFNDIRKSFKSALKDAGIKEFRFHDLRHTFASQLTMMGVDSRTIQELGRWKTPSMLMRYAQLSPEHMQSAVNTLDDLLKDRDSDVTMSHHLQQIN